MSKLLPVELNQVLIEQGFTERARQLVAEELIKARVDELEKLGDNKATKEYKDARKAELNKGE